MGDSGKLVNLIGGSKKTAKNKKQKSYIPLLSIFVLFLVVIIILCSFVIADQTTLIFSNGSQVDAIRFDPNRTTTLNTTPQINFTYGSGSYFDRSLVTPDVYATICHPNLEINSSVDFVYKTFSGAITRSVFNLPLQVTTVSVQNISNQTMNCTTLDVQFSSTASLYPGYVTPQLKTRGAVYYVNDSMVSLNNSPTFNGSIYYNLTVDSPPKSYWFYLPLIHDDLGNVISANRSLLLTSLVSQNNVSKMEKVLRPSEIFNYTGTLVTGDHFVVNGITLLNVSVFAPCGTIPGPGYYLFNQSKFNLNSTCINVTNTNDVQINFAGEVIDGDAALNGSFTNDTCAIDIRDSQNVTIEGLQTQQFYNGICIENSTVTIFGTYAVGNINGMQITNNSHVYVAFTNFNNINLELNITNNSLVRMLNNTFTTAFASGLYYDTWLKGVPILPTLPVIPGYTHINQFLQVGRNDNLSWAQIQFDYFDPLPNRVDASQVYIYEYNGTYSTFSIFNNITNTSSNFTGWDPSANWTQLFTLVSPQQHLIYVTNISSFSVFAPFGKILPAPPTNGPGGGGGGGHGGGGGGGIGGGTTKPSTNFSNIPQLRLIIPPEITIMQGDIGDVPFTLQNVGGVAVYDITVTSDVPRGWKSSATNFDSIFPGESLNSKFSLAVYEKQMPADYYIPVSVLVDGNVVLSEVLKVSVVPRGNLTRLLVTQYDPIINLLPNSQKEITFTAKNIGDYPLKNVQILLEPNDCIKQVIGSYDFAYDEEKQVTYRFVSGDSANCKYTLKFVEGDKLVDFVPVTFQIRALSIIEQTIKLLLIGLIVGVWFTVGIVIVIKRRKPPYQMPPSNFGGLGGRGLGGLGSTNYSSPLSDYSKYYRGK